MSLLSKLNLFKLLHKKNHQASDRSAFMKLYIYDITSSDYVAYLLRDVPHHAHVNRVFITNRDEKYIHTKTIPLLFLLHILHVRPR